MAVQRSNGKHDGRQADWRLGLARAAALGLLLSGCEKQSQPEPVSTGSSASEGVAATAATAKDCCMGKNDCKGKGGCAVAESNACAGKNDCKGKGGCNMHCPK
jgi:hypothetical protein